MICGFVVAGADVFAAGAGERIDMMDNLSETSYAIIFALLFLAGAGCFFFFIKGVLRGVKSQDRDGRNI